MTSVPQMFDWVRSHSDKLRRKGYEPPNHLANGQVRFFGAQGESTFVLQLDQSGRAADYTHEPAPSRIEVWGGDGQLLYTEQEAV